jgi:hypothetical protein
MRPHRTEAKRSGFNWRRSCVPSIMVPVATSANVLAPPLIRIPLAIGAVVGG